MQPHQNSENWILAQRSWVASRNLFGGEAKSAKLLRMFDFTRCNFIRSAAVTNEALVGKPLWPPLLETFLWKSPSPVTGLQKCNQQSYVLFARSLVESSSSILQFPKQKSWGKTNSRRRFFDEWILTHLFCWDAKLSPWTNLFYQVVFFAEQISQYTIQLGRLDSVCWRQKLSWREMFSVFWNLFAFTGFVFDVDVALSCIGFSQHQRLFSKSCFANMWTEFFKTNLGHKISFISVIIINSTYLSLTLHKVCFCFAKLVNEKTLHVRLDSTSRRYVCLSCLISSCTFYLYKSYRKWRRLSFLLFRTTNRIFVPPMIKRQKGGFHCH